MIQTQTVGEPKKKDQIIPRQLEFEMIRDEVPKLKELQESIYHRLKLRRLEQQKIVQKD